MSCGRQTPGMVVRSPADLDLPGEAVTCPDCRRAALAAGAAAAAGDPAADEFHDELRERLDLVAEAADAAGERLGAIEARIAQLEAAVEAGQARATSAAATSKQTAGQVAGIGERVAVSAGRLDAVERRLEDVVAGLAQAAAAQRTDLQAALDRGLDEIRSAFAAPAPPEERLRAVEAGFDETRTEMSELGDLHAALDIGLGQLRSEIAAVRDAQSGLTDAQDEFDRRLESVSAVQQALTTEDGRGRRGGKRSSEVAAARLAEVAVVAEQLTREQKQLRSELAVVEMAADGAADVAARAWANVSAVAPLRSEVEDLQDRLDAQDEALAALTEAVEALRRPPPGPAPAKRAPRSRS